MRALRWRAFWLVAGLVGTGCGLYLALRPSGAASAWFPGSDKLAHALSYLAMGLWFAALFERQYLTCVALGLFLFSVFVEILQSVMPYGRAAEWADLLANGIGIALAIGVTASLRESWMHSIERLLRAAEP